MIERGFMYQRGCVVSPVEGDEGRGRIFVVRAQRQHLECPLDLTPSDNNSSNTNNTIC